MSEKRVYCLHITQKNALSDLMNKEMADLFKARHLAITPISKNPMKYLATMVFKTAEDREKFYEEFKDKVDMELDEETAWVDEQYLNY